MVEPKRTGLSVRAERAVLLHTILNKEKNYETHIEELANLAATAGATVLDTLVQKRYKVDPYYYVGKGKAKQLAQLCQDKCADVVICNDDLAPAQVRNLERIIYTKVIDRSELILDIFATRAKTAQAKLQVELAQLEYTKPRLKRMWTHLSRIEGGIGTRGPGEKQLEVDRRIISKKIMTLKKKLRQIEQRRASQVKSRKELTTVSLVGYTNAGKSTLMNKLTGAGAFVEDKPFATLDTKTSLCQLGDNNNIVLSDTVGFIRKLPHHLISSFLATLEEVRWADFLLHVVDVSASDAIEQVNAVYQVLKELESDTKPVITILNKVDASRDTSVTVYFQNKYENTVSVSALSGQGVEKLKKEIIRAANKKRKDIKLICNAGNGRLLSYVHRNSKIVSHSFDGSYVRLHILIDEKNLSGLQKLGGDDTTIQYM
ncbi:MAG: GTPase HflX [Planctomycetes bacterium]|nr:GTPase HflX [Planctomycetota bacterium]